MTTRAKIVIGVVVAFLLLPVMLLLMPAVTAHADGGHHPYKCASHHWTRYLGVAPFPNVVTESRIKAHVCWWKHTGHGHHKGQVIEGKTTTSQRWNDNAWAPLYGINFTTYDRYKMAHTGANFGEARGFYDKWRQCQTIIGVQVCPNSGSLVLGWSFLSPPLLRKTDGSMSRWSMVYHEGKPGESPAGEDANVYMRGSD